MTKPIEATPVLNAEESKRFIEAMVNREGLGLTQIDKEMLERMKKIKYFD